MRWIRKANRCKGINQSRRNKKQRRTKLRWMSKLGIKGCSLRIRSPGSESAVDDDKGSRRVRLFILYVYEVWSWQNVYN